MSTAVAIQPAMPRPSPIPIAAARPKPKRSPSGKENLLQSRPVSSSTGSVTNIRTRRERPCDACRRRKSRCVIHEGAVLCVLCEFHKQECTFVQDPQPRKRKLTTTDGNKKDEHNNKKRSLEASPIALTAQKPSLASTTTTAATTTTTTTIATNTITTATNTTATNPSPILSPAQKPVTQRDNTVLGDTLGLQRRLHSRYIGLTTPFDPVLISLKVFDTRNESAFDLGTLRRVNDNECFIMLPDETTQQYDEDAEALAEVEQIVAPHGASLIDLYFRTVHPSFPIIQKQLLLQRYREGDRQFSPALIAGMYILALNWWSHDPRLASYPKPDSARLEAIASRSLAISMERPKLSTIQSGLLLLQRPEADSWSLTTQLVAIGQELGLHLDCSNWSIPLWERGLRKRIAWALYMQDKWSSLIHGRPSHIFSANWAVKSIEDEDFLEDDSSATLDASSGIDQEDGERGRALFAQMITLTNIMAEVMDTFYTQVAIQDFANAGKNSTRLILDRAKPVQIRLKDWFSKLPPLTRMDSPTGNRLSSTGYLHLAYFATEITLHRRIVQSLDPNTTDAYLTYICRSAAKTRLISAMDFVNRLKPQHLQAFWYFASKINFTLIGTFGSLLWATAPAKEEAEFYKTRLREYRWTLSVSSKRAEFLEYAVQMLDASRTMLNNLAEKPSVAQQISSAGVPTAMDVSDVVHRMRSSDDHQQMNDVDMDDSAPLTRYPSASSFSGFHNEQLEHYDEGESIMTGGNDTPNTSPPSNA